jgi:integrase
MEKSLTTYANNEPANVVQTVTTADGQTLNISADAIRQLDKANERNTNTAAAMDTDNKKFIEYCQAIGNEPTAAAILEYLLNLSATAKISTLRRKFATLSQLYTVNAQERKQINEALRKISKAQTKETNRARKDEANADGTTARDYSVKQAAAVTSQELRAIVAGIDTTTNKGLRDKTMFIIAFYGGLRGSELLNIRRNNIKTTDAGNIEIELMDTKTAGNAKIYIYNRQAINQIKLYIEATPTAGAFLFTKIDKYDNVTTDALTRQSWHRIVKANAPGLQTHSFRRGAITQIIRNGCDMVAGMQFSRHTSKSSFLRYLDTATNETSNGGKYL